MSQASRNDSQNYAELTHQESHYLWSGEFKNTALKLQSRIQEAAFKKWLQPSLTLAPSISRMNLKGMACSTYKCYEGGQCGYWVSNLSV